MSEQRKDGGAAFPFNERNDDGTHCHSHSGMSLRDVFAGQALTGIVCGYVGNSELTLPVSTETLAAEAYQYAEAMLEAREKPLPRELERDELVEALLDVIADALSKYRRGK